MEPMSRRHVAFVLDSTSDTVRFYLDGHLLDEHQYPAGFVAKMDCGMQGAGAYTGFGHRLPGVWAPVGAVQDWRYYREALTAEDIEKLAMQSRDANGGLLRTCALPEESWDLDWLDLNGHDCAWYEEHRKSSPTICASETVRSHCPLACWADTPCWLGVPPPTSTYTIWNRIMYLSEKQPGDGVVCVREDLDVAKECEVFASFVAANPNGNSAAGGALGVWWASDFRAYKDIWLDQCDALRRAINPFCSFSVPRNMNAEIASSSGYSISFWWKALDGTHIPSSDKDYQRSPHSMRRFVFLSQVSPPRAFLTVEMRQQFVEARFYGSCRPTDVEDVEIALSQGSYKTGEWYHFAAVFNARTRDGRRSVMIKLGLKSSYDRAEFDWCAAPSSEFLQGIQLPGGVLVSPIQITPQPLTENALQRQLYNTQSTYRVRRGPEVGDSRRMTSTIPYDRSPYSYHMSLVAPPIMLQTRVEKTETCPNKLGTEFHQKTWSQTVNGGTCKLPYEVLYVYIISILHLYYIYIIYIYIYTCMHTYMALQWRHVQAAV